MAIVFAAVVPHAPLLLPAIAKQHARLTAPTRQALRDISGELYARQPETIVIFSPHGPTVRDSIAIHLNDKLRGQMLNFGDPATAVSAVGAIAAGHRFKEFAADRGLDMPLQTYDELDYGVTVPLSFMTDTVRTAKILPIHISGQNSSILLRFGQLLNEFAQAQKERWALLASADFTRRIGDRPGQYQKPSVEEKTVAEAITAVDPARLLNLTVEKTTCGVAPTLAMLAALQPLPAHGTIRSFEAPMTVGLLTATFELQS